MRTVSDRLAAALTGGRHVRPTAAASSTALVSVVIPCYNYGAFLPACVRSVLEQPGVDLQVIIVDDASTDDSVEVARAIAARDSRVTVVEHSRNRGHIVTFNDGLELVKGEYVVLLSADDQLTPGALLRASALMEEHPSVNLVYGNAEEFLDVPPRVAPGPTRSWTIWDGDAWLNRRVRSGHNCIRSPEAMMRSSVGHEFGWYRADLPHTSDLAMWMRVARTGGVGRINDVPQAFYRVHKASMSRTVFADLATDVKCRMQAFEAILGEDSERIPARPELLARAHRTLAGEALAHAARATERGSAQTVEVTTFVDFAKTYPGYASLPQWRAFRRRAKAGDSVRRMMPYGLLAPARGIRDRVRWRQWRWTGV